MNWDFRTGNLDAFLKLRYYKVGTEMRKSFDSEFMAQVALEAICLLPMFFYISVYNCIGFTSFFILCVLRVSV